MRKGFGHSHFSHGPVPCGGDIAGFVSDTYVKNGETGTAIHQSNTTYFQFSASGDVVSPVAAQTSYGDTAGSDARTTSYAFARNGRRNAK